MNTLTIVFAFLVLIPVADYILEQYLIFLNKKMWSVNIPEKLQDFYPYEEYKKSQLYQKDNYRLSFYMSTLNLIILLFMLFFKGFALVDKWARYLAGDNLIFTAILFFMIIGFALELVGLPFSWYDTFVIEKKYGFNTMNGKTFVMDTIKSLFVTVIIGIPVLWLITWFYYKTGEYFWLYAWGCITVFSIFINFFYSSLIVPLFNKQEPLEPGPLREKIESFALKTGFNIKNIYVIDGSKRSTKSNAYFSGFGSKKRIVLYDTLMKDFSDEEIVAILAHEVGHYRNKHILQSLFSSILANGLMLFIFSLVVNNPILSYSLGADEPSFHLGLVVFGILYNPVSLVIDLFLNFISRKNEYVADKFAKDNSDSKALANALKKLSVKSLSNLMPHPVYVFFYYSHPPLLKRLERLE